MWIFIGIAFVAAMGLGYIFLTAEHDVTRVLAFIGVLIAASLIVCSVNYESQRQQQQKTYEMPERIDASPEEIAQRVLRQKPKKNWRYLEEEEKKSRNS